MRPGARLGGVAALALLVALASACSGQSGAATPVPVTPASGGAGPIASLIGQGDGSEVTVSPTPTVTGASEVAPTPIIGGLLTTAEGERVIEDTAFSTQLRESTGTYAVTRAAVNPLPAYRGQLRRNGWRIHVNEAARLVAERDGAWISLTTRDIGDLSEELPWATVIAYAFVARGIAAATHR